MNNVKRLVETVVHCRLHLQLLPVLPEAQIGRFKFLMGEPLLLTWHMRFSEESLDVTLSSDRDSFSRVHSYKLAYVVDHARVALL